MLVQRSRFCNTAALRDAILFKTYRNTKALLVAMMILTFGFTMFLTFGEGNPMHFDVGLNTFAGLFGLFGATAPLVALAMARWTQDWGTVTILGWHFLVLLCALLAFPVAYDAPAAAAAGIPHYAGRVTLAAGAALLAGEVLRHVLALRWWAASFHDIRSRRDQPTGA